MEYRSYPRLKMALDVVVMQGERLLGRFQTHDISLDGVFLQTGPAGMACNEVLDLHLGLRDGEYSLKGIVVRVSQQGAGIMLLDMSKRAFHAVFSLFKQAQVPLNRVISGIEPWLPASLPNRAESRTEHQDHDKARHTHSEPLEHRGLLIRLKGRFDISSSGFINRVIETIHNHPPSLIIFDLEQTRHLHDSGMALLLLLHQQAGSLQKRIFLINCRPEMRDRLERLNLTPPLHIAYAGVRRTCQQPQPGTQLDEPGLTGHQVVNLSSTQ